MKMHKIEVITQQKELAQLIDTLPRTPCLVGAIDVHFRYRRQQDKVRIPADTRVEIFTGENATELVDRLSTLENVIDIQSYPCRSFITEGAAGEDTTGVPSTVKAAVAKPSAPANCRISVLSDNTIRMTIDSTMDHGFLHKILHVLAIRGLTITGGRKYRQGHKDFVTFTTTVPAIDSIQRLQNEIVDMLEHGELSESTMQYNSGTICDDIDITVDTSGNLPTLIIRAAGEVNAIRKSLQERLYQHGLDTVIARFTAKENGIEDIYYLKQLSSTGITRELARSIANTISGENDD